MPIKDINNLLGKLEGVKRISNGYTSMCPAHKDTHRSLSITATKDNTALLYCHAGCDYKAILSVLGISEKPIPFPSIEEIAYDYTDAEGKPLYQVVRYHPKNFKQRRLVNSEWIYNLNGVTPTLYRLPEVIKAQQVFLVEGEKDVENLRLQGFIATTISGGASSKWRPEYTDALSSKDVVIIPDRDEAGQRYALRIATTIYGFCASVKIVYLPNKDISDWLESGHTAEELKLLYEAIQPYIPKGAVSREEVDDLRGYLIYKDKKHAEILLKLDHLATRPKSKSRYD